MDIQNEVQLRWINYKETFALVFKMTAIKVLLFVGINHGWSLSQMDVKNTFLHTYLKENVFIWTPSKWTF